MHDLQRHVKRWCPETQNHKRKFEGEESEDESQRKRWISFDTDDTEEEETREQEVFDILMDKAREENKDQWVRKYEKYIEEGMSKQKAQEKTEDKIYVKDMQMFTRNYGKLIQYILQLKNGPIHAHVMDDVQDFLSEGYGENKSIRMALKKNRHILEELWDDDTEMETDDTDDNEEDDEEEKEYDSEESDKEND
jgi:hypothetical protein